LTDRRGRLAGPAPGRFGDAGQRRQRLDPVTGLAQRVDVDAGQQRAIALTVAHQVVVAALLDDPATVQHDHPVGQVQRRDAMGDEHRGAIGQYRAQPVVDRGLGARVDRTGRVVQHEYPGVGQDRASQRDALALPAGQGQTTLADDRVVTLRQRGDELVCLRDLRRLLDLLVGGVRAAVGDIGADRVGEQEALLERDADSPPQRVQGHRPRVVPVDQHLAELGVAEPRDQRGDRRLAAAARPDQRHPLAGGDAQAEAVQHGSIGGVAEADVVEDELAPHVGQLDRARGIGDLGLRVEQLEDPLDAGAGLLPDRQHGGELTRRCGELADVGGEGQERADRDVALQREQPTDDQDGHLAQRRDRLEHRLEAGGQPGGPHPRAVQLLSRVGQPPQLALLLAERLDHPYAADALLDDLRDVALPLLRVPVRREDPSPHAVGHGEQRRHDHQRQQR
jgi:hypothetical protein